jgi:hypothetical protein
LIDDAPGCQCVGTIKVKWNGQATEVKTDITDKSGRLPASQSGRLNNDGTMLSKKASGEIGSRVWWKRTSSQRIGRNLSICRTIEPKD